MKLLKFISFLLFAVMFSGTIADAQKKAKEPKTVLDFYLLLPAEYITPLESIKNRQSLVEIKDVTNGYLTLKGKAEAKDWEGWAEIALFKKESGAYVIGVVNGENATMHYSGIKFLEYENNKWRDVTAQIFPEVNDQLILNQYKRKNPKDNDYDAENPPFVYYELPRRGTVVKMFADNTGDNPTSLFEFAWNGAKFELKK